MLTKNKPRYPLDSDLSSGWRYPPFEQSGPEGELKPGFHTLSLLSGFSLWRASRSCEGMGGGFLETRVFFLQIDTFHTVYTAFNFVFTLLLVKTDNLTNVESWRAVYRN